MSKSWLIESEILARIHSARSKITPLQLQKDLQSRNPEINRKLVRDSIRELVEKGEYQNAIQTINNTIYQS